VNSNADRNSVGLKQLILYFLKLGTIGFGGPIALVASMQKELVDERYWFCVNLK
jgi:chromate transporter